MLETLLNIPYYLGKDAELIAALQKRAPDASRRTHASWLRSLKRRRPNLSVLELEAYLAEPISFNPLFDVTMSIVRECDGAKFSVDTLWGLDGHVIAPEADNPALMKFLKAGKTSGCEITVTLKEDPSICAEVTLGKFTFETPDTGSLRAWYTAHYDANGQPRT